MDKVMYRCILLFSILFLANLINLSEVRADDYDDSYYEESFQEWCADLYYCAFENPDDCAGGPTINKNAFLAFGCDL